MSSDSHATVTYTLMSIYEVTINEYYGMPIDPLDPYVQLVMGAPPPPDYVPEPEAPPSPGYIPGPEYSEYLPPADDMLPAEEQPLPAAVLPTAESPGYITESEPEMEPEENDGDDEKSEGDSIDYPTSEGDNDANDNGDDLSEDDADNEDEEESSDKPFEEGETAATPPPFGYHIAARISVQPHILMPFRSKSEVERLLAIPTPPLSPVSLTSYTLPPLLTPFPVYTPLPTSSFPLPSSIPSTSGESSVAAVARQIRPTLTIAESRRDDAHNPDFVEHLAQKLESMEFLADNKKRKFPNLGLELSPDVSDINFVSNCTLRAPMKTVEFTIQIIQRHGSINDESYNFVVILLGLCYRGCEALVKRDTLDKLKQRSVKCIFIGYPKETIGYYFYFPPENKIVVARYADFFEKNLITQEVSGRAVDLEELHDEDTSPSEITSETPMEVEGFEPPQEVMILIQRSERTHRAPDRLCLNVEVEEHSQGDLNEPASYKAAMLDSESNKWIDAINVEIQSMIDNMVWVLVDLPSSCKTVGSKWISKKKTNMDGIVHTYKARLVAKGYTQLYGIEYEETFSPVADIRAIRILISIAAFYDYEIWKMDVKTSFLMVILMKTFIWYNLKVLLIIPEKYASFKDPFMVLSKHQEARIKDLMRKSKGEAAFILKIKIYRDRSKRLIGLGQNAYMDKNLKRYKMDNSKHSHIPILFLQNPGECYWTAVKHILKYLRNTKDMFLVYGGNPEAELRVDCYCDAGFETDRDDTKSQTGYVFILNGGVVDGKSSKRSTTAMSVTKAE
nr:retrovirus-related Pol polyprotein from transposon TNT 1-94 [Tanacetum cinerariifolium]